MSWREIVQKLLCIITLQLRGGGGREGGGSGGAGGSRGGAGEGAGGAGGAGEMDGWREEGRKGEIEVSSDETHYYTTPCPHNLFKTYK